MMTRERIEACRRIGRDETARTTTIGLAELDGLCDSALRGGRLEAAARHVTAVFLCEQLVTLQTMVLDRR